jgi:uncharacterized protein (UPF0264 family)
MQLLISVTNALEAQAALQGGADIIDVKNPAEGGAGRSECSCLARYLQLMHHLCPHRAAMP